MQLQSVGYKRRLSGYNRLHAHYDSKNLLLLKKAVGNLAKYFTGLYRRRTTVREEKTSTESMIKSSSRG